MIRKASIVVGISSLGDIRRIGGIGFRTLAYYLVTTSIAVGRLVQPEKNTSHRDDMEFIGLTTEAAAELAIHRQRSWRIIRQDGEPRPPGMAIKDDRLNFVIEDNQVIRVLRG